MAKRIKRKRLEKGFSLKEAANQIEVPMSTYKEWEYGRAIQGEPYEKIAKVFEMPLTELMTGKSPEGVLLQLRSEISSVRKTLKEIEEELLSLI